MKDENFLKEFYPNGKLEWVIPLKNGKRHGNACRYFESGLVSISRQYADGKIEGEETIYFSDGTVQSQTTYKNGKKNGSYRTWYRNGQLDIDGWYLNDQKHGHWIRRDDDNNLIFEGDVVDGVQK